MRFHKFPYDGDDVWISNAVDYGDFPLRFQIRLIETATRDREWAASVGNYHLEILATSTVAASHKLENVRKSYCLTKEEFEELSDESKHDLLAEYGIAATLWQKAGNNKRKLERAAREEMRIVEIFFGFYMDRQQNAIGDTGWDWIAGNLFASLKRRKAQ